MNINELRHHQSSLASYNLPLADKRRDMPSLTRAHSTSAIPLQEIKVKSHSRLPRLGSRSDNDLFPAKSFVPDRLAETDKDSCQHQDPLEPRGAGTAVPPASEPGDVSGMTPSWQEPASGRVGFWKRHVSCDVDFSELRDHLGMDLLFMSITSVRDSLPMLIVQGATSQILHSQVAFSLIRGEHNPLLLDR